MRTDTQHKMMTAQTKEVWPRKMSITEGAVNEAEPMEVQFPKSKDHKKIEEAVEAARAEVRRLQELAFNQGRNHYAILANDLNNLSDEQGWNDGPHVAKNATNFEAPAQGELRTAESRLRNLLEECDRHDRIYRMKQREFLTRESRDMSAEGASVIQRARQVLGLD